MNDLVGKQCLLQTDLNDAGYHKVVGATPLPVTAQVRPTNRAAVGEAVAASPASVAPVENGSIPHAARPATAEDPDADLPF